MAKLRLDQLPELLGDAMTVPYFRSLPSADSESVEVPAIPAVYFIFTEPDIVLYIGQTVNLRQRWKSHRFMRMVLHEVGPLRLFWLPTEPRALMVIERYYIRKLHPPLNKNHTRRVFIGSRWFIEDRRKKLAYIP